MCLAVYSQIWAWGFTSLLRGDNCGLQGLAPALSRLSRQSEDVCRLRGQLCGRELPHGGTHLNSGEGVRTAAGQAVGDLVTCGSGEQSQGSHISHLLLYLPRKRTLRTPPIIRPDWKPKQGLPSLCSFPKLCGVHIDREVTALAVSAGCLSSDLCETCLTVHSSQEQEVNTASSFLRCCMPRECNQTQDPRTVPHGRLS